MPTDHNFLKLECSRHFVELRSAMSMLAVSLLELDPKKYTGTSHLTERLNLIEDDFRKIVGDSMNNLPEDNSDLRSTEKLDTTSVLQKSGDCMRSNEQRQSPFTDHIFDLKDQDRIFGIGSWIA